MQQPHHFTVPAECLDWTLPFAPLSKKSCRNSPYCEGLRSQSVSSHSMGYDSAAFTFCKIHSKITGPSTRELVPDFGRHWTESSWGTLQTHRSHYLPECACFPCLACKHSYCQCSQSSALLEALLRGHWAAGSMSDGVLTSEHFGKGPTAVDPAQSPGSQQLPHLEGGPA